MLSVRDINKAARYRAAFKEASNLVYVLKTLDKSSRSGSDHAKIAQHRCSDKVLNWFKASGFCVEAVTPQMKEYKPYYKVEFNSSLPF